MTISAAEDWLVAETERVFGTAFKSIESGPGEWSDAYLERVVAQAPAIRIAFLDGAARDGSALTVDTRWSVYLLTGWSGGGPRTRRRGSGGSIGTWRAIEVLAPWLHNRAIPDVGRVRVADAANLWSGALDRKGLALSAIGLSIAIDLDPELDESELADFLRAGTDWDLPGTGGPVDRDEAFNIPQGEAVA